VQCHKNGFGWPYAVVTRDTSGASQMQAQPSLNGICVKIDQIRLTDRCLLRYRKQQVRLHRSTQNDLRNQGDLLSGIAGLLVGRR